MTNSLYEMAVLSAPPPNYTKKEIKKKSRFISFLSSNTNFSKFLEKEFDTIIKNIVVWDLGIGEIGTRRAYIKLKFNGPPVTQGESESIYGLNNHQSYLFFTVVYNKIVSPNNKKNVFNEFGVKYIVSLSPKNRASSMPHGDVPMLKGPIADVYFYLASRGATLNESAQNYLNLSTLREENNLNLKLKFDIGESISITACYKNNKI